MFYILGREHSMNKNPEQEKSTQVIGAYGGQAMRGLQGDVDRLTYSQKSLRSSLGKFQLSRARTREEMKDLAVAVWRQRGLALIDPLLIPDDFARQALINEANRLYGRRAADVTTLTTEVL